MSVKPKRILRKVEPKETSAEPHVVYHYTSMNGLMGILAERAIHATAITYLNDVKERNLLLDAVKARLNTFKLNHLGITGKTLKSHDKDQYIVGLPRFMFQPFVASFSRHRDSLVQWRAYCPDGNGVSIGFRTKNLRLAYLESTQPEDGRLKPWRAIAEARPVTYLREADDAAIRTVMEASYHDAQQYLASDEVSFSDSTYTLDQEFTARIEQEAGFFKHRAFKHEREFRVSLTSFVTVEDKLQCRTKRSIIIPFIPLVIPHVVERQSQSLGSLYKPRIPDWNAIASVTVGPTPNVELSTAAVGALLKINGVTASVKPTRVPYREW